MRIYSFSRRDRCNRSGWAFAKCEKSRTTSLNVSSPVEPISESFISSLSRPNRNLQKKKSCTSESSSYDVFLKWETRLLIGVRNPQCASLTRTWLFFSARGFYQISCSFYQNFISKGCFIKIFHLNILSLFYLAVLSKCFLSLLAKKFFIEFPRFINFIILLYQNFIN